MKVRKLKIRSMIVLVILLAPLAALQAQNERGNEYKINSNVGMVINVPANSTAQVVGTGWGGVGGAGYNFDQRNAVIGEFLWNRDWALDGVLQPLEGASQSSNLKGNTDLFVLTADYRYELHELKGKLLGAYFIGGGGLYFRNTWLSSHVTSGAGTTCTPAWLWWGFTCTSGTVNAGQTRGSVSSSALGANAGVGFTVRVGEAPYRLYTEARYHYAPTKNISTQFVAVTLGIRY